MGAEVSHADRLTDRHGEANSRFSQICEGAYNTTTYIRYESERRLNVYLLIVDDE